jgi:hypothetical protein
VIRLPFVPCVGAPLFTGSKTPGVQPKSESHENLPARPARDMALVRVTPGHDVQELDS